MAIEVEGIEEEDGIKLLFKYLTPGALRVMATYVFTF